jgi:hypothetical protein
MRLRPARGSRLVMRKSCGFRPSASISYADQCRFHGRPRSALVRFALEVVQRSCGGVVEYQEIAVAAVPLGATTAVRTRRH